MTLGRHECASLRGARVNPGKSSPRIVVAIDGGGMVRVWRRREICCRRLGSSHERLRQSPLRRRLAMFVAANEGRRCTSNSVEIWRAPSGRWPDPAGRWWSAVLVDMKFGDDDRFGLRVINAIHTIDPDVPVMVVSSLDQFEVREGETLRLACERVHAEDFLTAPGAEDDSTRPEHLASPENLEARLLEVGLIPDPEQEVAGQSLAICRTLRGIRQLIPADFVGEILLLGEPGSGKTHLAGYVQRKLRADEVARRAGSF